jgi:Calcineurin-like phosphoesterase
MIFLTGVFFCLVTIGLADNTARKLTFEGFFTIYGISESNHTEQNYASHITELLQTEIDNTLNFVSWKVILTSYNSVKNTDNANDDYAIGDLNFFVEAFLAPEDDVTQYYSDIVSTLNYILVDELLSGISSDALRGAYIPAGSLTIADGLSVVDGHTMRPSSSPVIVPEKLHLLMLGDWGKGGVNGDITAVATSSSAYNNKRRNLGKNGGTDYTFQAAVARSMMKYVRYINLRAVILLGDNFYNSGVTSTTDALWTTLWRNVYLSSGSPLNVPWYAVLGNHDYGSASNAEAQINRYLKYDTDDNNWIMPSHNYTQKFEIIGGGSARMIFIDTTTLAPSVNKCCNEKGYVPLLKQNITFCCCV